ncbi:MAG: 50S ribosomal protein L21 [Patescibacteria group bacterium]
MVKKIVEKSPSLTPQGLEQFAVIKTGGKQYKVSKDSVILIEKISDKEKKESPSLTPQGSDKSIPTGWQVGDKINFDKVLLSENGDKTSIGSPYLEGVKVEAEITKIGRARKILVVKYKQKSRYLRRNGHRQPFFEVKILNILK